MIKEAKINKKMRARVETPARETKTTEFKEVMIQRRPV